MRMPPAVIKNDDRCLCQLMIKASRNEIRQREGTHAASIIVKYYAIVPLELTLSSLIYATYLIIINFISLISIVGALIVRIRMTK